MGERQLIKVQRETKKPMVICPKCNQEIFIDISPFKNDCSEILRDNCPKCRSEIYAGIIILCHPSFKGFLDCLKIITSALNPGKFLKM